MPFTLAHAPLLVEVQVTDAATAPAALRRRLAEMGLRAGARVRTMQKTAGGGRIVDVAGARIALGRDVLAQIGVEDVG